MEDNRTTRFLIPPFVLIASVFLGAQLDPCFQMKTITKAIGSDSTLPTLIGIITSAASRSLRWLSRELLAIVVVRLLYWFNDQNFEAHVSKDAMAKLLPKPVLITHLESTASVCPGCIRSHCSTKGSQLVVCSRMNTFYLSINTITHYSSRHLIDLP